MEIKDSRQTQLLTICALALATVIITMIVALPILRSEVDYRSQDQKETRKTIAKALEKSHTRLPLPEKLMVNFTLKDNTWVSNAPISDEDLKRLLTGKNIHQLRIRMSDLSGKGMAALENEPIETLEIGKHRYDEASFKAISRIKSLKSLRLIGAENINSKNIKSLTGPTDLETLGIEDAELDDACVAQILKTFPKLTRLVLSGNPKITNKGLAGLSSLVDLEALALSRIPIKPAVFKTISNSSSKLRVLSLSECGITDSDTEWMKNLSVSSLYLKSNRLSDKGLANLSAIRELKYLAVYDNPDITKDGVSKFRAKAPDCRIKFRHRSKKSKSQGIVDMIFEKNNK